MKDEQTVANHNKRRELEEKLKGTSRVALKLRNKTPIPEEDGDFDTELDRISFMGHKKSKSMITNPRKMQATDFSSNIKSGDI